MKIRLEGGIECAVVSLEYSAYRMKVAKAPNYIKGEKQPIAKVFTLYKWLFESVLFFRHTFIIFTLEVDEKQLFKKGFRKHFVLDSR